MKYKIIFLIAIFSLGIFLTCYPNSVFAIKDSNIINNKYDNYEDDTVSCGYKVSNNKGEPLMADIPASIPKVTHLVYLGILIGVPIVLIIFGMLDLFKGLYAQKEEEIKKGQQIFLKRLMAAGIVFFAFLIVKLFIGFAANKSSAAKIIQCAECFIDNNCDS